MLVDFVFMAYYPLNQLYSDFVIPKLSKTVLSTPNGQSLIYNGTS